MARVLLVRCHLYRDTRVQREVAALLDAGHEVVVLCQRDRGEPLRERRPRLVIHRLPLRHVAGARAVHLLAEYSAFFLLALVTVSALHLRRRFDVVQVNSVPDALVLVAVLPRLSGARVLLDLQEPMPEFVMTRLGLGASHPVVRVTAALEQASIRFAHRTITVTDAMRMRFVERGAPADRVRVVMDGADASVFHPPASGGAGSGDAFVLVSHGTIEPQYGLDTAIEAVALLIPTIPRLRLDIIGDGSQREELRALARRLGVGDHVRFSDGFVPLDDLVAALHAADVGIVAMRRDAFRDLTLAGKLFDFVATGVPAVVSRTRSVQATFDEGCFELFRSGDAEDLARAVRRLHADPERRRQRAERAAEAVRPIAWAVQRERYQYLVGALADEAAVSRSTGTTAIRPGR